MSGGDLLVKISDGRQFLTVAGLSSRRIAFNGETANLADSGSAEAWFNDAKDHGIKRAHFRGVGLFKDAAAEELMRMHFFDGAVKSYKVVIPTFGTVAGPFQITQLEFAGEHNGEVTYEVAMESAGELAFEPAR